MVFYTTFASLHDPAFTAPVNHTIRSQQAQHILPLKSSIYVVLELSVLRLLPAEHIWLIIRCLTGGSVQLVPHSMQMAVQGSEQALI